MKGRVVLLDQYQGLNAAALVVDGVLQDFLLDPVDPALAPGAILRGKADRPMKGQGGVFVKLPDGAQGFLRQSSGLRPGQDLVVQVTGYAEPGKAVPVSTKLLFKSRYCIVTPEAPGRNISRNIRDDDERDRLQVIAAEAMEGCDPSLGLIVRSAADGVDEDAIRDDITAMVDLANQILADATGDPALLFDAPDAETLAWRDWADPDPDQVIAEPGSFDDFDVATRLNQALTGAPLPGGGMVFVEPTRAFVAVDVNTGADTSPAAGLKANIAAARDLPRLLRVLGLGGQIVIDFAPFPKKDRRQMETVLKAAFRHDSVATTLSGWTNQGNFELQRKRERPPLLERLTR